MTAGLTAGLTALSGLFLNNLLPVMLIVGAGYLLSKWRQIDPQPLSQVTFYIFSPCLIFSLLYQSQLGGGEILRVMLFAGLVITCVGILTWIAGRLLRLERRVLSAVLLASMFMNAGNFGLPVILFVFGEDALSYASLFFVTMAILTYSLGIIIASMGTASLAQAIQNLLKIPIFYALLLALLMMRLDWQLPVPLERTTQLLGNASIPSMLVLLGLQLRNARWSGKGVPFALASGMRLLAGPILALAISPAFGLQGAARQASILESAMPTAVMATVLATEYDVEPSFVSAVVFGTTLVSPLTLLLFLAYLGG